MRMEIGFPGGLQVESSFHGHTVLTDQPQRVGGDDAGPAPFELFLASLATCAGFYALRFCQQRQIETEGLGLTLEALRDPDTKRLTVALNLKVPTAFPEKYEAAILRSVDQCAVKRALFDPPEFEVELSR